MEEGKTRKHRGLKFRVFLLEGSVQEDEAKAKRKTKNQKGDSESKATCNRLT